MGYSLDIHERCFPLSSLNVAHVGAIHLTGMPNVGFFYLTTLNTQCHQSGFRKRGFMVRTNHQKFEAGQIVITSNAQHVLAHDDVQTGLRRHFSSDWGECCPEDSQANDGAIERGGRILSVYRDREAVKFWIITEADRSATTVLLPEDY